MKIQCDVCTKEASVFCCADEAALCTTCDRRVHLANKLASKHRRFSILLPSSSSSSTHPHPLCDICQEKQGLVFCQQDRAILCKDCDASIHTANDLTMKHSRFILTGARLSAVPIPPSSPPPEPDEPEKHNTSTTTNAPTGSSISEYLVRMLPGWRVEDLLVDDAAAVAAAAATTNIDKKDVFLPFLEADQEGAGPDAGAEDFSIWVPHMRQFTPQCHRGAAAISCDHPVLGTNEMEKHNSWSDDGFAVPDSSPSLGNNKRPRASCWHF